MRVLNNGFRISLSVPDERRLIPVTLAFALFGVFWGSWAVSTAEVERALKVSPAGLGLLLSASLLGAAAGNTVGGAAAERWGTGRVLGGAYALWGVVLVLGGAMREPVLFGLAIVVAVTVGGVVDVAMNVAATVSLGGQPGYLVRFHARFNAGAVVGAGCMGALLATNVSWRLLWFSAGIAALGVGWLCHRSELPGSGPGERLAARGVLGMLRSEALVLLAVAFALGAMVEGGIELWGVLYLRTRLNSGLLVGAGGAVIGYTMATMTRVLLGPRVGRRGAARGVLLGAGTAAAGCLALALSPAAVPAAAGLVLAAGGISMTWPLLIAEAGAGRSRPGAVIGAVTTIGYLGLLTGPILVGLVAAKAGLRWGLVLLAAAAVMVALVPVIRSRHRNALERVAASSAGDT